MARREFTLIGVFLLSMAALLGFLELIGSTPAMAPETVAAAPLQVMPTVIVVDPNTAPNDLDTQIVITGTNFAAVLSGTQVITPPAVYLGDVALEDVGWVSTATLTATVPWGMNPGAYTMTVVNPGGEAGNLPNAFTVTQAIGQWNGGDLFGGNGHQILFKPGDPDTMYAEGYRVGLFRSRDGGETWDFVFGDVGGNIEFVPDPHHPSWLYFGRHGLYRSQDEGNTWDLLFFTWPDGSAIGGIAKVYVSPHIPGKIFFSSAGNSLSDPVARGLLVSSDNGATWQVVGDLDGVPVVDLDFHPTDPLRIALVTADGRVFQSIDGGDHWSEAASPGPGSLRLITHNPYNPAEVWVSADYFAGLHGVYTTTDFANWQDVSPSPEVSISSIKFTGANSVYLAEYWGGGYHSTDGGLTWQPFGADTACCDFAFHPDNPQIVYTGDTTYGIQKSTDGGQTWGVKNQGFSAMFANEIDASPTFPQRVYAVFEGWNGIFRSNDGATTWNFLPITDTYNVRVVREDPFNTQRVYVAADPAFYISQDGGLNWTSVPWDYGMPYVMEPDPHQSGRLLAGFEYGTPSVPLGKLYASNDYGLTWTPITVTQAMTMGRISDIAFHPETQGLVYLATEGDGLYRSTDGGYTWERIDDQSQPAMEKIWSIAIATHPQPMLVVQAGLVGPFRSYDGGETWETVDTPHGSDLEKLVFVGADSTRLYGSSWKGLMFSADGGKTWSYAAGALGRLHIVALDAAATEGRTVLYAATTGGEGGTSASRRGRAPLDSLTSGSGLVKAGIYRYVLRIRHIFLPMVQR